MKILFLTNEKYPCERPMVTQLWNINMTSLGNSIVYIMRGNSRYVDNRIWENNQVIVFPIYKNKILDFLLRNTAYLFFIFYKGFFTSYDLLHVHNGNLEGFIGSIVRKFRGKVLYTYGYTFPFIQAMEIKILKSSIIRRIYYKIQIFFIKQALKNADLVLPISEQLGEVLCKTLDISLSKQFVVSEAASELFLNCKLVRNFSNNRFSIVYVGSLAKIRNPEFLIKVFELVVEKIVDANFLIMGWADKSNETIEFVNLLKKSKYCTQIQFVGKVPYEQVPFYLSFCDVGLSPIVPKDIYYVSTPTKCVEYLSLGIPVVANYEIPDQKFIIEKSRGGLLAKYSPDDFSEKICYLLNQETKGRQYGIDGKKWVIENRTYKKIAQRLNIKLETMIND